MRWLVALILIINLGTNAMAEEDKNKLEKAVFAAGCFWCIEAGFDLVEGVISTTSGYTGGHTENPTYAKVSAGDTGHYEALEVLYDPNQVTYKFLLNVFWQNIDPTDRLGQFTDRGPQYRTAIFYKTEEEKKLAEESKVAKQLQLEDPIMTDILPASKFYPAEIEHQDFYKKNPIRYDAYKKGSGREKKLEEIWGKD